MSETDQKVLTGGCLCGRIRYAIHAPLAPIQICYCRQCQKAQGTPFASNTPVATTSFEFIAGQALLREYESSAGKFRAFCSRCGSPMYSRRDARPQILRIRAGTLDQAPAIGIAHHAFTSSQAPWWPATAECPHFPAAAPQPPTPD